MVHSHLQTSVFVRTLLVASIGAFAAACSSDNSAPSDSLYVMKPDVPNNWIRVNEDVKLKSEVVTTIPQSLMTDSLDCISGSGIGAFVGVKPKTSLVPPDSLVFQVKIRNDSHYVVKLLSSEVTLFDPNGESHSALDREKLKLHFMSNHACKDSPQLDIQFINMKLVDGKFKILPGRANKGYVIFKPQDINVPGAWSLSFFDMAAFSVKQLENRNPKTLTFKFTLNETGEEGVKQTTVDESPVEKGTAGKPAPAKSDLENLADKIAAEKLAKKLAATKAAEKAAAEKAAAAKAAAAKVIALKAAAKKADAAVKAAIAEAEKAKIAVQAAAEEQAKEASKVKK